MKLTRVVILLGLWGLICPGLVLGQEQQKEREIVDHEAIKKEISQRWDPEKYDKYPGHVVGRGEEAKAWRELFGRLIPGKGLRILDAGCGTGEISFLLAGMGYEVYGIDISKKMLAKAKEKAKTRTAGNGGGRVHFQLGDAEKPPFENGFFDAVVCKHVLWTLPSPQTALDSWTRILKDNGKVIVIDALWDDGSLTTSLRRKVGRLLKKIMEREDHGNWYSPALQAALPNAKGVPLEKARVYMEQAGLQDIQDVNLNYLSEIQKKNMPFWYSVSRNWDYYAICGQKRSPN
jgi:ubiquinone/menaquinone biosynthesis C-methylase UbiE